MTSDSLFHSFDAFRQSFVDRLAALLEDPQPDSFILVLANAIYDEHIHALLQTRLEQRFSELSDGLRQQLITGQGLARIAHRSPGSGVFGRRDVAKIAR
ncbi:hypothetical protein [Thiolapillus sp.]|uniref:hypothetical protein n=1 Tax=Thiolapillus sp. TaxID=2017437 RepID=UPI003AF72895